MKSPKQLRCEIQVLRSNVEAIRESLFKKILDTKEPTWGIGKDCARTAEALGLILKNQIVPEFYKVAVVGRFKAGKSSFVNELLGARLAGEDTTPETAAVTIFSHQESVKAVIHFVNLELWEDLRKLYKEDPKHIDAHPDLYTHLSPSPSHEVSSGGGLKYPGGYSSRHPTRSSGR